MLLATARSSSGLSFIRLCSRCKSKEEPFLTMALSISFDLAGASEHTGSDTEELNHISLPSFPDAPN